MMSLSSLSFEDVLTALELQYEWGIDAVVEDQTRNSFEPAPHQLVEETLPSSVSTPVVQSIKPSVSAVSQKDALLSAPTMTELLRRSEYLEGVNLSRTATHRLKPIHVEDAPFVVVGEVPNADEDRFGTLFAGQAGEFLDKMLASVHLARHRLSMVPSIPWRPPGGQRASERDLAICLPLLQRSIALCRPSYVVTMGATPMQLLLETSERLSQVRGQWREVTLPGIAKPVPLFPMMHPLQLVGGATIRRHIWRDLLTITARLQS